MRHVDYTGVSGIGVVAYGVVFSDGQVALRWTTEHPATSVWASLDDVLAVHGHDHATSVQWIDQPADVLEELAAGLRPEERGRGGNPGAPRAPQPHDPTPPPESAASAPAQPTTNGSGAAHQPGQPPPSRPGRHRKSSSLPFAGGDQPADDASADANQHNGLI